MVNSKKLNECLTQKLEAEASEANRVGNFVIVSFFVSFSRLSRYLYLISALLFYFPGFTSRNGEQDRIRSTMKKVLVVGK